MNSTPLSQQDGYVFRDRYPERDAVYALYDKQSAVARELDCFREALPYGNHPRERYDLFLASDLDAPLVVFFHGGYWQSLDRSRFSFIGARLAQLGFTVALPSYPLCPETTLDRVLKSSAQCLTEIFDQLAQDGRKPRHWIISGHSAGGHIAAWLATSALPINVAQPMACIPISGIFDLTPLLETTLNSALGLSAAQAKKFDPIAPGTLGPKIALAIGASETDAFQSQSRGYGEKVANAGGDFDLVHLPGLNHYTVLSDFLEEHSILLQLFNEIDQRPPNQGQPTNVGS